MTYITPEAFEFPVTWVCGGYQLMDGDCIAYCDEGTPSITLPLAHDVMGRKYYIKSANGTSVTVYPQEDDLINGSTDPLVFLSGCYELIALDWGMWEVIAFSEV
jgi:hypothetical protein